MAAELKKVMKCGDVDALYNALQIWRYSMFIDIRHGKQHDECRLDRSVPIPLDHKLSAEQIGEIIDEHKSHSKQSLITKMFFFTDDLADDAFWNCLRLARDSITDSQVCRLSQLFLIAQSFDVFAARYPFLCTRGGGAEQTEVMEYPNVIVSQQLFLGDCAHAANRRMLRDLGITHIVNCSPPQDMANKFADTLRYVRVPVLDGLDQNMKQHFAAAHAFIHRALELDAHGARDSDFSAQLLRKMQQRGLGTRQQCRQLLFAWVNAMDVASVLKQVAQHAHAHAHVEDADEKRSAESKPAKHKVLVHCQAGISRSSTVVISYLMRFRDMSYDEALLFVHARRPVISPNSAFVKQLKAYEAEIKMRDAKFKE